MRRLSYLVTRAALLVATATMVAACGSGAVSPPDDDTGRTGDGATADAQTGDGNGDTGNDGGDPGGNGDGNGNPPDEEFTFTLPVGEAGVDAGEAEAYPSIQRGDCRTAQQILDNAPNAGSWHSFDNPRNVLLFQAGIHLCAGDTGSAGELFNRAANEYGFAETAKANVCPMYQVTASVLFQRPPDDFPCQGGEVDDFVENDETGARDDPRTPENEAEIQE